MRFLMYSLYGEGAAILHQMELEGNEVELFIKDKYHKQVWDGLIPKAKVFKPKEGDVVVFDFSGSGKLADSLRKSGFATYGGSEFADKLEQDRMFGLNLMEQAGIKIPLTANFDDFSVKLAPGQSAILYGTPTGVALSGSLKDLYLTGTGADSLVLTMLSQ